MNHYHHGLFVNRRRLREVAQAAMTSINVTLPLDTLVLSFQLPAVSWWLFAVHWRNTHG